MKNKDRYLVYGLVLIGMLAILSNCVDLKEEVPERIPVLSTSYVSQIHSTSAVCGGNITYDAGINLCSSGVCWSTSQNPTTSDNRTLDGQSLGSFTSFITGLSPNTVYYVRAYASNCYFIGYGEEMSFTTLNDEIVFNPDLTYTTVTDIDNNVYKTITIGTQTWMAENLKVTHYRNGDHIPLITDGTEWKSIVIGACCNYRNNPDNSKVYGKLYNWCAVSDSRNIAPDGWHVPTDNDWTILAGFLGGEAVAGGKLKEVGTNHWLSPNTGATNESGFTGLPGGGAFYYSDYYDLFHNQCESGIWWTSDTNSLPLAYFWNVTYSGEYMNRTNDSKNSGFSVRCIKD